ncbi:MAG: hypothetical protein ISR65_19580 [Bacteriovoracaceae bacterium]|nr:hypothetical protein [Bacteriovoracaceae bacterium]
MKKLTFLVLCILTILPLTHAYNRESGARLAPMAMIINFTTLDSEIDQAVYVQVKAMIDTEHLEKRAAFSSQKRWGIEGKRRLCVEFSKFTDLYKFKDQIKELLNYDSTDELGSITINYKLTFSCRTRVLPSDTRRH